MVSYAINPQTQKKIKVGGPTWNAIEAKGGKMAEEMKASVGAKAPSNGRTKKVSKPKPAKKSPSPIKPSSPVKPSPEDNDIFMGIISKTPKSPRKYFTPPSSPKNPKSPVKPKTPVKSFKSVFTTPKPSGAKTTFNPLTVFQSTKNAKTNYWLLEGSFEDCSSIRVNEFTENSHENAAIRVLEHLYRDTGEGKGKQLDSVGDLPKKFFMAFSAPKITWKGSAEATLGILNEDWVSQMEKGTSANIFGDSDWGTKWLASFMRPFVFAGKQHLVVVDTPETRPLMEIIFSETYRPAPKVTLAVKKAKPVSPQSPAKGLWADWTRGWKDLYF